jgi:hypothetical protein
MEKCCYRHQAGDGHCHSDRSSMTSIVLVHHPELTPVLQLNPYASLAWSLLSKIPEVRPLVLSHTWGIHSPVLTFLLGFATTGST